MAQDTRPAPPGSDAVEAKASRAERYGWLALLAFVSGIYLLGVGDRDGFAVLRAVGLGLAATAAAYAAAALTRWARHRRRPA